MTTMTSAKPCRALSRQGNFCAREEGHVGCHEVYVDGDGRRWWDDIREFPEELAELLQLAARLSPSEA